MTRLTTLDLPKLARRTVGFENIFNELDREFSGGNYPPYNIVEVEENEWKISIAVAGFGMEDLEMVVDGKTLSVTGTTPFLEDENIRYLHRGLSTRNFERKFQLADHVEVEDASLNLGVLTISLKRNLPEALQPKRIEITNLDQKAIGK